MGKKLDEYRYLIDEVDDQIIDLLDYRFNLVSAIAIWKVKNGYPAKDPIREKEIYQKYKEALGEKDGTTFVDWLLDN